MEDENTHVALLNYIYLKLLEECCEKTYIPEPQIPTCAFLTHVVESGEALSVIAAKYGVTIEEILAENPQIVNPNNIYARANHLYSLFRSQIYYWARRQSLEDISDFWDNCRRNII